VSRPSVLLAPAILAILTIFGALAVHSRRSAAELVETVSNMPVGISVLDAEAILGGPADEQLDAQGVVVNYVTFIPAGLPWASDYGEPDWYRMHLWRRGRETVVVVCDTEGLVVCRCFAHRSRPDVLRRMKQWIGL
jgi:hypothetical protein